MLVVEDETHLADGLKFNLEAEGYMVQVVGDGESAIDRLLKSKEKFDAVVLDVMLPGIDGFGVATALRQAKNYVPVLMLTARGRPEDVLEGFAAGADDYLPKPFQLPIFLARLQGLLRRTGWMSGAENEAKKKSGSQKTAEIDTGRRSGFIYVRRKDARFRHVAASHRNQHDTAHVDGSEASAPFDKAERQECIAQVHFGRCVGFARRHRHTRHR